MSKWFIKTEEIREFIKDERNQCNVALSKNDVRYDPAQYSFFEGQLELLEELEAFIGDH